MAIYVTKMPIGYCNNYKTHEIVVLKQTRSDIYKVDLSEDVCE